MVLESRTDPEVPPLPSHITLKDAKNLMSSVLKSDPGLAGMIVGTARQVLSAILPKDKK